MKNEFFVQGTETKRFSRGARVLRKAKWDVRSMLCHRDDDIALFVSCVDVPVSLGNVFQRIASIDDRLYLPRLNQLCEEN